MSDQQALKRIAANVRRLRGELGLSQAGLARKIDDYPGTIQRIEAQENMPGVGLLTRIAEALDATVNDLLEDPKVLAKAS